MIKELKSGDPLAKITAQDWNEMARFINHAQGADGCRTERSRDGGLVIRLGDDDVRWRTIQAVEPTRLQDGTRALAFRSVRVLCGAPLQDSLSVLPLSGAKPVYDDGGDLTGIDFGGTVVAVEPCDS